MKVSNMMISLLVSLQALTLSQGNVIAACALVAPSSGRVQSSFGLICEGPE